MFAPYTANMTSYAWAPSIALDFASTALQPATATVSGSSAITLATKDGKASSAVSGTNYIQAQFFVKVDGGVSVKFGECSVTSSNIKDYALLQAVSYNTSDTKTQGTAVKAAAGNALRMAADYDVQNDGISSSTLVTTGTDGSKKSADAAIDTIGKKAYTLGTDKATTTEEVKITNFGNSMTSSAFANRYYDAVAGNTQGTTKPNAEDKDPYKVNTITSKSTELFTAAAVSGGYNYKVYAVCLTFWLEGYDADCFDAILGQSMLISVSLTTESSK